MRNGQAYQRKNEKFSVFEEKKFGKIGSCYVYFVLHILYVFLFRHLFYV